MGKRVGGVHNIQPLRVVLHDRQRLEIEHARDVWRAWKRGGVERAVPMQVAEAVIGLGAPVDPLSRVGAARLSAVAAVLAVCAGRAEVWLVARAVILEPAGVLAAKGEDAMALLASLAVGAVGASAALAPIGRLLADAVIGPVARVVLLEHLLELRLVQVTRMVAVVGGPVLSKVPNKLQLPAGVLGHRRRLGNEKLRRLAGDPRRGARPIAVRHLRSGHSVPIARPLHRTRPSTSHGQARVPILCIDQDGVRHAGDRAAAADEAEEPTAHGPRVGQSAPVGCQASPSGLGRRAPVLGRRASVG